MSGQFLKGFMRCIAAILLLACRETPVDTIAQYPAATLALVLGFRPASDPEVGSVTVRWLVGGKDTSLSSITDSLPATTTLSGDPAGRLVYALSNSSSRTFIVEYDYLARKVLRRVSFPRFSPIPPPVGAGMPRNAGLATGLAAPVVAPALGLILAVANAGSGADPGLLAISVATLRPVWFLPGRDVQAIALAGGDLGTGAWLATRHAGTLEGQGGSILKLDLANYSVSDSNVFPGRTAREAYPFLLLAGDSSRSELIAVTANVVFSCSGSPLRCTATQTPVSGTFSRVRSRLEWLQNVSNPSLLLARTPLRLIDERGEVIRDVSSSLFGGALSSGIVSAKADTSGRNAVVLAAPDPSMRASQSFPVRFVVMDLTTLATKWRYEITTPTDERFVAIY